MLERSRKNTRAIPIRTNKKRSIHDVFVLGVFVFSVLLFYVELDSGQADYYEAITEPGFGEGYTPLASVHLPTNVVFLFLATISIFIVWIRGRALPPILFVLLNSLILIGFFLNIAILIQISQNSEEGQSGFLGIMPSWYFIIVIGLMGKIVMGEKALVSERKFTNPALNWFNSLLINPIFQPVLILVLTIPMSFLVTMILVLFGQDSHAITKVFTETTTWTYSQKSHPPYLPHMGHYLCTVAACGDSNIVKPLRLGTRHGQTIIVNRQLQIANAFEELIQENLPTFHKWIRTLYDDYGYPLSKKINTPSRSNMTYRSMKPLEYLFLLVLYIFCIKPETKIARQYKLIGSPPQN